MNKQITTLTINNPEDSQRISELLAQLKQALEDEQMSYTEETREIQSSSVCSFLGLQVDTDKVNDDVNALLSGSGFTQAKQHKARNANQLKDIL